MVKESLEEGYLFLAAGVVCILAVIVRCLLSICYGYWVRASSSMDKQNSQSLERLKKRFETMYQMNLGVRNVDIFVDKYLITKKICGLYLSTWESISGQVRVFCGVIGIAAGIIGTYYDCGQVIMLSTISVCVGGIAFTLFVDIFSGLTAKKFRLKTNISDYFENYLKVRLELYDDSAEYAASTFDMEYNGFDDLGYGTYVNNKIEKAEKKFLEKKMKLERKEQIKKLKKEKKEVFEKVKKEKKNTLEQLRIQKEKEALAEMRKRREERQKVRKERVLEEMRDSIAVTEEIIESDIAEVNDDIVAEKKYSTEVENKIIEEVLKEFLV